jgi:UDP-GlcNAc:undecaprenyl-phosphate GlcNAc-1-phosphate transferase
MALGHGHRRSVFILWTWTALLSGFVLWPIYSGSGDGIVPFGIAAILLSLFTILHPGVRLERRRLERDEARDARRRAGLERSGVTGPIDSPIHTETVDSSPPRIAPTTEEINGVE